MFVQLGLRLSSDMSIRIYSEASIAENPLLAVVLFYMYTKRWKLLCTTIGSTTTNIIEQNSISRF